MAVLFANQGLLDIRALTTFGVSVKENENSIGEFGTGFDYALATCLRYGQDVRVQAGDSIYKFSTKSELIRGEFFDVIYISANNKKPKPLNITTRTGKNWTLYDAYRELYSNCMDEGGEVIIRDNMSKSYPICVMVKGQEFEEVHANRHKIILNKAGKKLLYEDSVLSIYEGSSTQLFYRGIAAKQTNFPTLFTYNIKQRMDLTEDRTLASEWDARYLIANSIISSNNDNIIIPAIIEGKTFESELEYRYIGVKPTEIFKGAVRKIRETATARISDSALSLFYANTSEISDVFHIVTLTEEQKQYFNRAKEILSNAGLIPNIDKYEVIFVEKLSSQSGEAFKGKIIINQEVCSANIQELISTILEEYIHIEDNVQDCTRKMQNRLFEIISQLVMR
jgi:hypothetical protein